MPKRAHATSAHHHVRRRHIAFGGLAVGIVATLFGIYVFNQIRPQAQVSESTPTNLAINGSFETSTDAEVPDGWNWSGDRLLRKEGWVCARQIGSGTTVKNSSYDGECAFVINGNNKPGYLTQTIATQGNAGDTITFRVASKPTRVVSDYPVLLTIGYYDGGVTNTYALSFSAGTSDTFQTSSTTFSANAPYSIFTIKIPYDQSRGTAAFDGVSLTKFP